jgi:signal transduction histidine kinase
VDVDLGALVTDAADLYGAVAEERALVLDTLVSGAPLVQGDRDLLFQALVNLVDNAVKYTPRGGRVTLQAGVDDGSAFLRVADSGPGIPVEDHEKVLERFYRLERSRSTPGSGLGLSLVAAVAQAHQAVLLLEDNSPGLRVTMRFDETTA